MVAKKLILLMVVFGIGATSGATESSTAVPTAATREFLAWLDSLGLKDSFVFVIESYPGARHDLNAPCGANSVKRLCTSSTNRAPTAEEMARILFAENDEIEDSQGDTHALTFYVGSLEHEVGIDTAERLYKRLFTKLLTYLPTSPDHVELRIEFHRCGSGEQKIVRLASQGIVIDRKQTERPCRIHPRSVSFSSARKYRNNLQKKRNALNIAINKMAKAASSRRETRVFANMIQHALTERYSNRGGSVLVTGKSENWLEMVVHNLQGEVLKNKKYWERLQLFILLEQNENATLVRLILDGKYAAGFSPPDDLGYSDMEPAYTESLSNYGNALALSIAEVKGND